MKPDRYTLDWRTSAVRVEGKGWVICQYRCVDGVHGSVDSIQSFRSPAAAKRAYDKELVDFQPEGRES